MCGLPLLLYTTSLVCALRRRPFLSHLSSILATLFLMYYNNGKSVGYCHKSTATERSFEYGKNNLQN